MASSAGTTEFLETLAAEIGERVYIDVAKWHLYLGDAHLHTVVAERAYPLLEARSVNEDDVLKMLREIPVKIGGGRKELTLLDLLPMQGQLSLIDILEDFQNRL